MVYYGSKQIQLHLTEYISYLADMTSVSVTIAQ